jgi:hypothetical protein
MHPTSAAVALLAGLWLLTLPQLLLLRCCLSDRLVQLGRFVSVGLRCCFRVVPVVARSSLLLVLVSCWFLVSSFAVDIAAGFDSSFRIAAKGRGGQYVPSGRGQYRHAVSSQFPLSRANSSDLFRRHRRAVLVLVVLVVLSSCSPLTGSQVLWLGAVVALSASLLLRYCCLLLLALLAPGSTTKSAPRSARTSAR